MGRVDVIVADDHPVVQHGIIALLSADTTFRIVASCNDGATAVSAIRSLMPQLALLDMNMPGLHGLEILKAVVAEDLPVRIIFLAASPSDKEILAATAGGAFGIVLKEMAPDTLISCLHAVAAGEKWLPDDLIDGALMRMREHRAQIAGVENLLTLREIDVMLKVADGLSNRDVGSHLNISEGTVKIHLNSVYRKTGISNRSSLTNFAIAYRNQLSEN